MPARRTLRLPIPVTIVTGALASGKTTAISSLLHSKPDGEVWAVLVNEFGSAGIDAALLEGGDRVVHQLAGGCLCCVQANVVPLAIAQLLRRVKPDRLIVEPSGLAHPAALVDLLQGPHLGASLALRPVVCLLDVSQFAGGAAAPACLASQVVADQVSVADVLVGSKADACDEATLQRFQTWARQLFPPKQLVATARHGHVDTAALALVLGAPAGAGREPAEQSRAEMQGQQQVPVQRPRSARAGHPWLSSTTAAQSAVGATATCDGSGACDAQPQFQRLAIADAVSGHAACGWIFDRTCVFAEQRLSTLLEQLVPKAARVKGVFRVAPSRWVALSGSAAPTLSTAPAAATATGSAAVALQETAYRTDSRVELIVEVAAAAAAEVAASGLPCGGTLELRVAGALAAAAAGDWLPLEALLLETLQ